MTTKPTFWKKNHSLILSFFIPFIIMVIAFAAIGIFPFGKNQVLVVDFWHQYFPFLIDFHEKITGKGSLLYSWNIGMGTNYLSLMAYYTASPLYYLSRFVSKDYLTEFVALCIILKISFSGAAFNIFLKGMHKKSDLVTLMFSIMYALCSFSMGYYWCLMWLDCVAILPLILLGLNKLLDENRYKLYVFSLSLALISNYYIGALICIFIVFYYIVAYLIRYKITDIKMLLQKTGSILLYSIIGVMISCIIVIPTFKALQLSSGVDSWAPTSLKFYHTILELVNSMWMNVGPTVRTGIPNIYSGLLAFILLIIYIMTVSISRKERIINVSLLIFLLLGININYLDYAWHVFHFPNELPHRFAFVFSFMLIHMAYKAFTHLSVLSESKAVELEEIALNEEELESNNIINKVLGISKKHILSIMTLGVVYFSFAQTLFTEVMDDLTVYLNIIFWIIYCTILLVYHEGKVKKEIIIIILLSVVIIEGGISALNGADSVGSSNRETYKIGMEETRELVTRASEVENGFYRTEITTPYTINSSALYSYKGISQFSSSANAKITLALSKLGLAGRVNSNRYTYYLSTPVINSMLAIKYIINRTDITESEYLEWNDSINSANSYKYKYFLPIGYMVDKNIFNWDLLSYDNPFEAQNDYIINAANIYEPVFTPLRKDYTTNNNLSFNDGDNSFSYTHIDSGKTAQLEVWYTANKDQTYYLYAVSDKLVDNNITYSINGEEKKETNNYSHMIELGQLKAGDNICVKFDLNASTSGSCTSYVYGCDTNIFRKAYNILSDEGLIVNEYSDTMIKGNISVEQDGILYTSIPYEKGWSAKVDGKKVEIIPLNDAFSCLELSTGVHTVEFKYVPDGFILGYILTILGLIVMVVLIIYELKTKRPLIRTQGDE